MKEIVLRCDEYLSDRPVRLTIAAPFSRNNGGRNMAARAEIGEVFFPEQRHIKIVVGQGKSRMGIACPAAAFADWAIGRQPNQVRFIGPKGGFMDSIDVSI